MSRVQITQEVVNIVIMEDYYVKYHIVLLKDCWFFSKNPQDLSQKIDSITMLGELFC